MSQKQKKYGIYKNDSERNGRGRVYNNIITQTKQNWNTQRKIQYTQSTPRLKLPYETPKTKRKNGVNRKVAMSRIVVDSRSSEFVQNRFLKSSVFIMPRFYKYYGVREAV